MPMHIPPSRPPFEFIGGTLCLDFTNTVSGARGGLFHEGLTCYADLLSWSQQAHLLDSGEMAVLLEKSAGQEEEAAAVLVRACALREATYHLVMALIEGKEPAQEDLYQLNMELGGGASEAYIALGADGFTWRWKKDANALDQMLGPLARSVATLLTTSEYSRARQCASPTCTWLFLDHTKNHRRQWCANMGCGNKDRVRRHRQRKLTHL